MDTTSYIDIRDVEVFIKGIYKIVVVVEEQKGADDDDGI